MPLLSVIVPAYNEAKTIRQILEKISAVAIDKEIIVVDDCSTDGTDKILRELRYDNLKAIYHSSNRGKGAAFLTGLHHASGKFVIIQDADLEYEPVEYIKLIQPLEEGRADIVIGSRFFQGHQGLFFHRLGNRFLTAFINFLFRSNLNDYASCYKLASKETFFNLRLKATGFDIDVEIICNALKERLRILEIPIIYSPRFYSEGKKIRWIDGLWAIYYIFKYRIID